MNRISIILVLLALAFLVCGWSCRPAQESPPCCPAPAPMPSRPRPTPCSEPALVEQGVGATVGGPVAPDGTEVQIDLPNDRHVRNTGGIGPRGPGSGAGLCVFTSIQHAADWQGVEVLQDFQKWMTTRPGGGYPSKVDKMIGQKCAEAGTAKPAYLHVTGADLDMLRLACKTGRMPGVTYCRSFAGRYGGQRISHMVSLVHLDERWAAILDNNFPKSLEWLSLDEFRRTYVGGGGGWGFILLDPGPPPTPRN